MAINVCGFIHFFCKRATVVSTTKTTKISLIKKSDKLLTLIMTNKCNSMNLSIFNKQQ